MLHWLYRVVETCLSYIRGDSGLSINRRVTVLPYYKGGEQYNVVVIKKDSQRLASIGVTVYASLGSKVLDITQEPGVEYNFSASDIGVTCISTRSTSGEKHFLGDAQVVFDD